MAKSTKEKKLAKKMKKQANEILESVDDAEMASSIKDSQKLKKKKKLQKTPDVANTSSSSLGIDEDVEMGDKDTDSQEPSKPNNNDLNGLSKKKKSKKEGNADKSLMEASASDDSDSDEDVSLKKSRKASKKESVDGQPQVRSKAHDERTVFVGNVSTTTTRRTLSRFFSKYGKVDAVRLRCAPVATPQATKKLAVITQKYHDKRTSLIAYVRFTDPSMVEGALAANGAELDGKHLQVDRSEAPTTKNTNLAVFVGNLSFEAEEEELRTHFASCGEIDSIRIIRDRKLNSGKGFGYINFKSQDGVEMALRLDGQLFMQRQLRIQRCKNQKKKAIRPKLKTKGNRGLAFMKTKSLNKKPKIDFTGKKMIETKKFKKMKAKGKLSKEDRKKKFIAHKLAGVKT